MDTNKQNTGFEAEDPKVKLSKFKHCEFDMYGDCDGSGDDVELSPDDEEI